MAAGLSRRDLEQFPPKERHEKALTAMAEARARKQRAEKHAEEAPEQFQKAVPQEQAAEADFQQAKALITAPSAPAPPR
eukprot:2318881-Lingulodinium_polyedra.AAC.1